MEKVKRILFAVITYCVSISASTFAQAPNISYSPSSATLTQNTAMTAMTPINSGGAVGTFGYGAGTSITGGSLDSPWGVVIDASGNLYVANFGNGRNDRGSVSKYNPITQTWSTFATDSISNPTGIAIDNSGNVFVLNYLNQDNGNQKGNAYVTEYNSSGTLVTTVVQGLGTANGISINSSNGNLDVAEGSYNGGNTVVSEYTTAGALNFSLSNAAISNPVNVATDGSGNIYVLNNAPNQVVKFSSTGTYISTFVSSGLTNPYGIYVDGSGNIYVSDSTGGTNTVNVYNSSGTFLTALNGLASPQGLVTDTKGNLYVTDYTNNTLTEYPPTGGYFISGKLPPGLSFNYLTGTISGTPTTAFSATTYTITAYNASGSGSTTVTLSCNANPLAPTIYYSPSVQVFTTSTLDTLKAFTTNSPNSFSSSPSLPAGFSFTSAGYIVGTTATVTAAKVYTITATNTANGLSATTTVSLAFVKDNYWTGNKNSDWKTKQNWSANTVPTSATYASVGVINYTGPDPIISTAEGANSVGYLVLGAANAATITVQPGASLTVNNIMQVNTNSTPILSGGGSFYVYQTGILSVVGTGDLTINSGTNLILSSGSAGSASVDAMTSGVISGQVTVQRYMSAVRSYRLMSSPVYAGNDGTNNYYGLSYLKTNVWLTGDGGGFDKAGNPTLYLYRENLAPKYTTFCNSNFIGVANITNSAAILMDDSTYPSPDIPVGNGYLFYYRGSRKQLTLAAATTAGHAATTDTLNAVGTLNQGSITVRDWYTPSSANLGFTTTSGTATIEGSNLVGNPYACSIDWDQYVTGGITYTNLSPFSYQLVVSGQGSGNYNVYQAGSVSKVGTQGNTSSNIIASGQGFFVFATGAGASLTFTEKAKTLTQNTGANLYMSSSKNMAFAKVSNQFLRMQLAMDSINTDGFIIRFNNDAKTAFSPMEDAMYRAGTGKVSLSSLSSDNVALAINQLPLSNGVTIPMNVAASTSGTYTLTLKDIQGVPQLFDVWLKDAFTGDSVNMRTSPSYTFSITPDAGSKGSKRFSIIMRENPAYAYQLVNFNAEKSGKQSVITWAAKNEDNYTHFTVERSTDHGQTYQVIGGLTSTGAGTYSLVDSNPQNGENLYFLKSEDYNGALTDSKVVKVMFENNNNVASSRLNLYPNPVVSTLNLKISPKSTESTTFNVKVSNSSGLILKNITVTGTTWEDNIGNLLSGTYIVEVTDKKDNSLVGKTKFVKM